MSYHYASSRSSGMGGYGSYGAANAYGNPSLSAASGTGMDTRNTGTLSSDEEEDATPTRTTPAANNTPTPESSARDLAHEAKGAHKDVKGFAANFDKLRRHLEDNKHAASPAVHNMVHSMEDHIAQIKARLAEMERKAQAHHASFAPTTTPPIAAHSMGRAPSTYSSGSYSRYRY